MKLQKARDIVHTILFIPVYIVLGSQFADGGNDGVEPPHCIPLDGSNIVLESPQLLQICTNHREETQDPLL